MDMFEQIQNAKASGGGQKIEEDGDWLVEIKGQSIEQSQNGLGSLFVTEFVIHSKTGAPSALNPPGAVRSVVYWPEKNTQVHPGLIKAMTCAILDKDEEDLPASAVKDCFTQGAGEGRFAVLTTKNTMAKSGQAFVKTSWRAHTGPVPGSRLTETPTAPPAPPAINWLPNPNAPGWEYDPATGNQRPIR